VGIRGDIEYRSLTEITGHACFYILKCLDSRLRGNDELRLLRTITEPARMATSQEVGITRYVIPAKAGIQQTEVLP